MRISVDIGFGYTKAVNEKGKSVFFPSVVAPLYASTTGGALGYGNDDYIVRMNDKDYYVGDAAMTAGGDRQWEEEAAENANLNILVGTAVHVLMSKDEEIDLVVGLPMSFYTSQRKAIKETLLSLKTDITIGGKTKHVQFSSVFVFPQSAGVYYHAIHNIDGSIKDMNLFNKQVGVIDCGNRTVDLLYMARGRKGLMPREELSGSEDLGMYEAHKIVQHKARALINGNADLIEIEKSLLWFNGDLDFKGQTYNLRKIQKETYAEHAQKIVAWVKQKWGDDINTLHSVIIGGGGGEALFSHFEDQFPSIIKVEKPILSNAYGYLAAQALAMRAKQEAAATKE